MAHGLDIAFLIPALAGIIIVSSHTSATTWVINVSITQCYIIDTCMNILYLIYT